MYPAIDLSNNECEFNETLQGFIEKYVAFWQESTVDPPIQARVKSLPFDIGTHIMLAFVFLFSVLASWYLFKEREMFTLTKGNK